MGKARRLLALLLALALLPCFCAALAEGEEQKVPDAKAVYEHDGVTYYQVQRDDDKAGLESPAHFYLDLMKNDRKDKSESKTNALGDYSTADLWAIIGWSCLMGNILDYEHVTEKDTITSILQEAVEKHDLIEKKDSTKVPHWGYCTDAVYAESIDAAQEELYDTMSKKLYGRTNFATVIYDVSKYPEPAVASTRQPVVGTAYHFENISGCSGVFVYLTDFKVVALLPDADDKSGNPYVQSIVEQPEPSKQSLDSDVINLTLEPVTASQTVSSSWSTTVGSTVSHSSSYSFAESISLGMEFNIFGQKLTTKLGFKAEQAFSDGWSSSTTQSQSESVSRSVTVPLPPYTKALMEQENGKAKYETKYNCPIGLRFTVRILGYGGTISGTTITSLRQYYQFGPDARADINKRAILDGDLDSEITDEYSYAIHWPQVAKVKAKDFDAYDYIRAAAKFVPFGPTNATFTEELNTMNTSVKSIVPVEPLSVIKLQAPNVSFVSDQPVSYGNFNYLHADMKVGDSSYTNLLNLSGQNVDGAAYYGFNPRLGHWEVTDAQGNLLGDDAPVRTEKQNSGTTKYIAQKPGTCFLKYFIDEESYLRDAMSPDEGYTTNKELIMTAALEITVTEDAAKPTHTVAVTGSYAGQVRRDAEKLDENGLAVSIRDESGKEIDEAYTWEAQELPARGISLSADGAVQFTKPGAFHVRAVCQAHSIASDWVEITAVEKGPARIVTPPTAREGLYDGREQSLLVPGEVEGGTMVYCLDTDTSNAAFTEVGRVFSADVPKTSQAGTYKIWYKALGDATHTDSQVSYLIATVLRSPVQPVKPDSDALVYNGKAQALVEAGTVVGGTLQYFLGDKAPDKDGDWSADIPTGTDAGNYTVWYRVKGDKNHNDSDPASLSVTIEKKPLLVTPNDAAKAYGDADPALTWTADGLVGRDSLIGKLERVKGENVGAYAIRQGSLSPSDNYALTFNEGLFEIEPKAITVKANDATAVYGEADPELEYTVDGLVGKDKLTGWLARKDGVNVGKYPITQGTLAASGNYTLNFEGAAFTITKRPVTVTAQAVSKTYGDSDPELEYTVEGLMEPDQLTGSPARKAGENAGDYAITRGTLAASDNYTLNFNEGRFTITPKAITVKAKDATAVYGETDPELEYTVTGLVGSDKLIGRLAREDGVNVGKYPITQGSLAASGNYTLNFEGAVFTITKRPVTVKAHTASKTYGNGDPELKYTIEGLMEPDQLTGKLIREAGENVGAYIIGKGSLAVDRNYKLTFKGAKFTINPRTVTVTAKDASKVVGSADPKLTYSVKGLVNGDTMKGRLSRQAGETPGSYTINQGTLRASKNYAIRFNGANLTITAREQLPVAPDFTLLAKMTAEKDSTIFFSWTKVDGAIGYDVFFKDCDGDQDYTLYKSVMGLNFRVEGLKKGRAYKGYVRAWTNKNGNKAYIGEASPVVHCIVGGYNNTTTNAKSVKLNKTRLTLVKGKSSVLKASAEGAKSGRKVLKHTWTIRYYSSNANVAKVNRNGKVTAVEGGVCWIYAITNDGLRARARVRVISAPQKISFAKASYTVKRGKTLKMAKQVKLKPAGVESILGWTSSDPTVATVSADGVVKGVKKGRVTITVVAENGRKAKVTVDVK